MEEQIIQPVPVQQLNPGLKEIEEIVIATIGTAKYIYVQANSFSAAATSCTLYYYFADATGLKLLEGNLQMTEEQFALWGSTNDILYEVVAEAKGVVLV